MRLLYMLALTLLSTALSPEFALAKPLPDSAMVVSIAADTGSPPRTQSRKRALVHGLPQGWTAVFQTIISIQPPLVNPAFIQFFSTAAKLAAADPVPGRHVQRIPFGALVLEFVANGDQTQMVTREFVVAASLWLRDAAEKGWTGFFNAWVLDTADGDMVFVRLRNAWDELMSLTY